MVIGSGVGVLIMSLSTLEALRDKQNRAKAQAYVDYGIYGLLDEDNIDQLDALMDAGVSGFKCFMGNTFGDLPAPSDGAMLEGFEILARRGWRCTVHAENPSIMARRVGLVSTLVQVSTWSSGVRMYGSGPASSVAADGTACTASLKSSHSMLTVWGRLSTG